MRELQNQTGSPETPKMTQLTTTSHRPSIHIFSTQYLSAIDRKIYSGFTEHMGRCIYGGLYDPSNSDTSLLTPEGFRKDVIEALKPLEIPVFRYPGGNFCATYHWIDGVGPREARPTRPELAWESVEPNTFGTDEFMVWCKTYMKAEPYLCLNFGTGTLDEALAWVEYCNGTKNTYYADLRRRHGHQEPYNVKYWALGNEMWGDWQMCQMTPEAYAEKAFQWAKALKLLDPTIKLVLCGKEGATSWDYTVLKHCLRPAGISDLGEERGPLIDMHSIHLYTASTLHYENVFAPLAAERAIEVCKSLIDLACIENGVLFNQKKPKICFDEWNVWSPHRAPGSKGAEEQYTLSDALAVAVWLNVLVRKSADLGMANIAQSVNVISPLMTTTTGVIKQTTWFVYELFCKFMRGRQVAVQVGGSIGEYEGTTRPDWLRGMKTMKWLDVSAAVDEEGGWINVAVVNAHEDKDFEVDLRVFNGAGCSETAGQAECYTVTGSDLRSTNMYGSQEVGIKKSAWDISSGSYTFPKHSFTLARLQLS